MNEYSLGEASFEQSDFPEPEPFDPSDPATWPTDKADAVVEPEPSLGITILDLALHRGVKEVDGTISGSEFARVNLALLGGCENCHATLGAYNAYPSQSGYWRCEDCIGSGGFATVEGFELWERDEDEWRRQNPPPRLPGLFPTVLIALELRVESLDRLPPAGGWAQVLGLASDESAHVLFGPIVNGVDRS